LAIKEVIAVADWLSRLSNELGNSLYELERDLLIIRSCSKVRDLGVLLSRVERMRELKNMMELGSFSVRARTVMDECWRELP
jgi:hypothetical protein